jgi:hypothetical protein
MHLVCCNVYRKQMFNGAKPIGQPDFLRLEPGFYRGIVLLLRSLWKVLQTIICQFFEYIFSSVGWK